MADVHKLVFSILKFLEDQKTSGQLDDEAVESLEVAVQCLEQVYKINTSEEEHVRKYMVPQNLLDMFNAQLLETESDLATLSLHEATPEQKEEAEKYKNKGNDFMKEEKYSDALESYTQAIKLDGKNAVYFCNRAAAFSKLNKHQQAIEDCNRTLTIDPGYSKAYGRLGIAYTALEDHESAYECYRKALELDPDNQSYQNNLEIAEQKLKDAAVQAGFNAGPAGNLGAFGGMRNMDFGSLFSDPNIVNMATTMMSNPHCKELTNDTVLEEAHTTRLLISKIRKRQATFFGHVMRREKLENLVTTGMLEGKRSRGKQREKLIEGLADWLKAGKSLEAIEATKDRKKWRTMIANAVKQGT
ncbi:small glutamine-rich tetratricopeptide repeat-containing protein alpha-like [Plakobranchus ocellatus]|uniref:Small glutamine-rich tetratricopeptide repeat-containing protein alpha-like n=1 Tax=Plakobranchus ocellatus TaxID=259542 RepID=A0AAV3YXQ1_9GAST|nr:small glutamine-rich tetratricopeptide repeat-containing protein alpha-like [Plakobranchus ocellatus]